MRNFLDSILVYIQFFLVLVTGKVFGISYVIRYLRNPNPLISSKLLRLFGATIDRGTTIKGSLYLDNVYRDKNSAGDFSHLKIGQNCYVGEGVYFDLANEIIIDDNVVISAKVSFVTHADCNRSEYLKKIFPRTCQKIMVGKGAWLAFGSTVLNGVSVGENSVVAAHSLLKEDVEKYGVCAGVPAKKIRDIRP